MTKLTPDNLRQPWPNGRLALLKGVRERGCLKRICENSQKIFCARRCGSHWRKGTDLQMPPAVNALFLAVKLPDAPAAARLTQLVLFDKINPTVLRKSAGRMKLFAEAYRSGHNEAVLKCDWFQWVYFLKSFYNGIDWLLWNLPKRPIFGVKRLVLGGKSQQRERLTISTTEVFICRLLQKFLQNHFHLILYSIT